MADSIQFRRGLRSTVKALPVSMPGFVEDEDRLIIGKGDGTNAELPNKADIDSINSQMADIVTIDSIINITNKTMYKNKTLSFKENGALNITGELILDNCKIISNGKICFYGTGIVRGTINDINIPYQIFDCWHNLQLSNQRTNSVENGTLYIDALLGDDTNDGLTSNTPIKSFATLVSKINVLISDATIIIRGGRYEIASSLNISNVSHSIIIKANNNEKVQVTSPLEFFNSSSNAIDNYDGHIAVSHDIEQPFTDLWDTFTGETIEVANTKNLNGTTILNRNANNSATVDSINHLVSFLAGDDVKPKLDSLTSDEIQNIFMMTWQSFTTQYARMQSYNNGLMTYHTENYANGDRYYTTLGKPAPYFLKNVKTCANDSNFFTTSTNLYLPRGSGCYFTAKKLDNLITIDNVSNITFTNIEFCYNTSTDLSIDIVLNDTIIDYAFLYAKNNSNVSISKCKFHDIVTICGAFYCTSLVEYCEFYNIGSTGIKTTGVNSIIRYNNAYNTNTYNLQGQVFHMEGLGSIACYNKINKCSYIGIEVISEINSMVYRNVIKNIGCDENGVFDESHSVCDGGAVYIWGGKTATYTGNTTLVYENIIYNSCSHDSGGLYIYRGIMGDNGVRGLNIHDNLIFNISGYSIDVRQVNSITTMNNIDGNIVSSPIKMEGLTDAPNDSIFGLRNILTCNNSGSYVMTLNNVNQISYIVLPSITTKDVLVQTYKNFENVGHTLAPFIKQNIRSNENMSYKSSLFSNGWRKSPDGFIEQWGAVIFTTGGTQIWNFPIAFPNCCLKAVATMWGGGGTYKVSIDTNFNLYDIKTSLSVTSDCGSQGYHAYIYVKGY